MTSDPKRIPALVGVGQIKDRPGADEEGLDWHCQSNRGGLRQALLVDNA